VTDIYGYTTRGWTGDEWPEAVGRRVTPALRRAGINDDRQWHVTATSVDSVSRNPARVPFAAYPLHPVARARESLALQGDCTPLGFLVCRPTVRTDRCCIRLYRAYPAAEVIAVYGRAAARSCQCP
jgi:hypothetical protein